MCFPGKPQDQSVTEKSSRRCPVLIKHHMASEGAKAVRNFQQRFTYFGGLQIDKQAKFITSDRKRTCA